MKGSVKIFGVLILGTILIAFALFYNNIIIGKDEVFNAVRQTQMSIIKDGVNLGDLIVHDKLSLNEEYIQDNWFKHFQKNISTSNLHKLEYMKTNHSPPGIAVNISGESTHQDNKVKFDYSNVVILEKR